MADAQKPLEEMTDDELLQLHAKEVGLEELNDEQLARLDELHSMDIPQEQGGGLGRAFVQSLPMAGSMLGGGLGATFGGVGAIPGAMLGASFGKAAQTAIEGLGYGEPKTREEIYGGPLLEAGVAGIGEGVGPLLTKGAGKVLGGLKSVASSTSKIPARSMEVLYERPQDVAKISAYDETSLAEAADSYRANLSKKVEAYKSRMNKQISDSLEAKGHEIVDISKTVEVLENNLKKIDPQIHADRFNRLNEKLNLIKSVAPDNQVTPKQAFDLKEMLQEASDYRWMQNPLVKKDFVDMTLARAANETNRGLKLVAPEIGAANKELSGLRRLNKNINKNIVQEGKPFQAIIGAGTGENQRSLSQLQKLGNIIGTDLIKQPENIAAASYFNQAGLLPKERTGSSLAPLVLAGTGGALGALQAGDLEGAIPGLMAGALASPIAIKTAIKSASALRSKAPAMSSYMLEKMVQGAIQQGISPMIMDNFVKKSDLSKIEKALVRKQITEPEQ